MQPRLRSIEKSRVVIDVYANPTLDLRSGRDAAAGGPGLFIALFAKHLGNAIVRVIGCKPAKQVLEAYRRLGVVVHPCGIGDTVFRHESSDEDGRRLGVEAFCLCNTLIHLAGDIAVLAPVYWEHSIELLPRLVSSYRVVVVDLQGYSRYGTTMIESKLEQTRAIIEAYLLSARESKLARVVVRASIEDVGGGWIRPLMEGLVDIVTMGYKGFVLRSDDGRLYCVHDELAKREELTGAGDVFDAALGYELHRSGGSLLSAAIAAHKHVIKTLAKGKVRLRYGEGLGCCSTHC